MKTALEQLAANTSGDAYDGVVLEYTRPVSGGSLMPTLVCFPQRLAPGQSTHAHRHTSGALYHVAEGRGCSIVGDRPLGWEQKDTFCVPGWTSHQHANLSDTEPAFLFSFTDIPVFRALDL